MVTTQVNKDDTATRVDLHSTKEGGLMVHVLHTAMVEE